MPFKMTKQKFSGSINECVLGTGEKAITIGGEKGLMFLSDAGHAPAVGIEITDSYPEDWEPCLKDLYGDVMKDPVEWAKYIEANTDAQFIELKFSSADPNGADRPVDECVEIAVAVEAAVDLPLIIGGCKNAEKDSELLSKISQALMNKNVILFSAVEDNYKTIGIEANADGNKVSGESAVDINLAKQLNILMDQLGVNKDNMVMDIGSAAVGYGFEYVASTMDRIRLAALGQNDDSLQMPIITNVADDAWGVKEAVFTEEEAPEWGSQETRGIDMEVSTVAACLIGGSNAVVVRHPKSAAVALDFVKELVG
ncbi:MAG: acetyl-CoA decarbonylase/synthase complex subunit delta [Eubacterium aggregans]|uniref:Acetyl-CoA decarbonylase/synthase delta subunit n=1 Tax=Eubacterium aggregans TaxID=81409 RepID=A0A1H3XI09_9FIRM|nr:acetyl-CoA decarbonylase/synthase complex subunit delta [Eubacterium aggregans]MDD4690718.1 acetyl-CoA decarbonylase/synthase complex subunit delta [Eubacterium aggregans]MEA5072611.1 acetyl-CoA decarbonylase/synthase complex subunit delta [Eubacterium aggregans]SDZ98989.1 acetyl-CoA decarbonylase/synthase delta subunit [Eubacterium aggregans]